tara:strand:- start:39 stop:1106 length:1068 start_codon:yes stop_codon:yes gene_type:complete
MKTILKKILSIVLMSVLLLGEIPIVLAYEIDKSQFDFDLRKNITLEVNDLDSGKNYKVKHTKIYYEAPEEDIIDYVKDLAKKFQQRISESIINIHIETELGYTCKQTICVNVTYEYDNLTYKHHMYFSSKMIEIEPKKHDFYGKYTEPRWRSSFYDTSIFLLESDLFSAKSELKSKYDEIESKKRKLSEQVNKLKNKNRKLSSKKREIKNQEIWLKNQINQYNTAVKKSNKAAKETQNSLQIMNNKKIEAARLRDKVKQKEIDKLNTKRDLENLKNQFKSKLDSVEASLENFYLSTQDIKDINESLEGSLSDNISEHNNKLSDINSRAKIEEGLESSYDLKVEELLLNSERLKRP